MLSYNLKLAWLSIRQHKLLSVLMVAAIGVGIAASMSMLTVYYMSAKNPIPHKSDHLFHVQLDNRTLPSDYTPEDPPLPPDQIPWKDVVNLLQNDMPDRQAAMFRASFAVEPADGSPFMLDTRVTNRDFFALFDVPFLYGDVWSGDDPNTAAQEVVLTREINEKLFGGEDSVGRSVNMSGRDFRVVGVIDDWRPNPKFYDVTNGAFNEVEEAFVPLGVTIPLQLDTDGNTNCNGDQYDGFEGFMASECRWLSYWVEFEDAGRAQDYAGFIEAYLNEQRQMGRFERPNNYRVIDVMGHLVEQEVASDDTKIMVWLAFLFLLVCLLNTIGLILAKLFARRPQLALRRAVGASRMALFSQVLVEILLVGLLGGVVGVVLAQLGLSGIETTMVSASEELFSMDWVMVGMALLVSLVASMLAGLYPAYRISQLPPAASLKTQ